MAVLAVVGLLALFLVCAGTCIYLDSTDKKDRS